MRLDSVGSETTSKEKFRFHLHESENCVADSLATGIYTIYTIKNQQLSSSTRIRERAAVLDVQTVDGGEVKKKTTQN